MSARAAWRLESLGFSQVFRYTGGRADWSANGLPMEGELAGTPRAGTLLQRDVPTCSLADRIGDIEKALERTGWDLCVVVNKERIVLGLLWTGALKAASEATESRAEDVMQLGPPTIRPDLPPEQALEYMKKRNTVLVTTSDGQLLGVLHRGDVERVLE